MGKPTKKRKPLRKKDKEIKEEKKALRKALKKEEKKAKKKKEKKALKKIAKKLKKKALKEKKRTEKKLKKKNAMGKSKPIPTEVTSIAATSINSPKGGGEEAPDGGGGPADCTEFTSWLVDPAFVKGIYVVNLVDDSHRAMIIQYGFHQANANRELPDAIAGPYMPDPNVETDPETPAREISFGEDCHRHYEFAESCDSGFYAVEILSSEQRQWYIDNGVRPEINNLIPNSLKGPLGDDPFIDPS